MRKNNFFNFKHKNQWDIGWPASPRKFAIIMTMIIAIISLISLSSCQNMRVKNFGGSMTIELKANQKLMNVTWKDQELWYLTTEMDANDKPKTSTFHEKSKNGILEGTVIFKETR